MYDESVSSDRPSFSIETHGCKLNTADSQQLAEELIESGYVLNKNESAPDVYILNSCTVTHVADRKARKSVSAARRKYPETLVVASGCYAQRDPETVAALTGVDLVVTNRQRHRFVELVTGRLRSSVTPCANGTNHPSGFQLLGRTRASLKIQEGCNQVCAYCIVPTVRGRERSVSCDVLIERVTKLVESGCREVVLTGTQLGSYGFDLESINLSKMLKRVLYETDIERLRVSSLQPQEMSRELLGLWNTAGKGRLCPHFHIPLQAGSDEILKKMRRQYTASDFLRTVEMVRTAVQGCSITIDLIAGFPGETEIDFEQTLTVVEKAAPADAHIFPYSLRPGTSAAYFDNHQQPDVIAKRAMRLREETAQSAKRFKQTLIGTVRPVLWEQTGPLSGLTDNYVSTVLEPTLENSESRLNKVEDIFMSGISGDAIVGIPVASESG